MFQDSHFRSKWNSRPLNLTPFAAYPWRRRGRYMGIPERKSLGNFGDRLPNSRG